jgi:cephalosporin hydroxylase
MEQWPGEIVPFTEWLLERRIHNVLEIGVRFGGTASLWCGIATGKVVGIDWTGTDSLGDQTRILGNQMERQYSNYRFICGDSHKQETYEQVLQHVDEVDFLFIDGDHSYAGIAKDFAMYSPLVRQGGCIAFHDIVDTELTRKYSLGVHKFWKELPVAPKFEFCVGGEWGGIGAITYD